MLQDGGWRGWGAASDRRDASGKGTRMIGTTGITERKQAKKSVKARRFHLDGGHCWWEVQGYTLNGTVLCGTASERLQLQCHRGARGQSA
jgi:hypothetical protein